MKKIITLLLILALSAAMLCSCKKKTEPVDTEQEIEETTTYKFGYSCISMKNPFFFDIESNLRQGLEAQNHELITKDAQDDAALQIEQIKELIAEEVDAVFLIPVDWIEITPALDLLNEAGIPIINLDARVQEVQKIDAYIGSDHTRAGTQCGEDLLTRIPEGGEIVIVECPNRTSINDRIKGFEKAIAKKGFEVVARIDAKGKVDRAAVEVEKVLAAHPDVVAIMCGSDPMAIGSLVAAKTLLAEDLVIYGVDGSPEVKKEIAREHSLIVATVAQSTKQIANEAVKVGLLMLDGENFERNTYLDTFLITKENVQDYDIDEWQ